MGDAARPGNDRFAQVLQESLDTWSSYLDAGNGHCLFPRQAIDLKSLVCQTPPFLGDGLISSDEPISFACEEKPSRQGKGSLVINCRSTWKTSKGVCDLQPRVLPKQLLLAVDSQLSVRLSEDSPFSDWPGVQGISGYDNGNYLSVLYLAWAYILSARWVELLGRSLDHECRMGYNPQGMESSPQSTKQPMVWIDLGDDVCEEEAFWWRSILCSDGGWSATTKYNDNIYLSPWSVSTEDAGLSLAPKGTLSTNKSDPPRSGIALKYLSSFCMRHRLYAQCSVALAGALYIPFVRGGAISLPFPKLVPSPQINEDASNFTICIPELLGEHDRLLSKYMTLSSNVWGLRSLLCSTFFSSDIECNLVSAWLNPAFAVVDSISSRKSLLATLLANRQSRLGALWLGAILTDVAKSVLCDIKTGMTALDLPASAWTGTTQTFLTSKMGGTYGELISRDDECRLLFITACEGHERPPIWSWKPFGFTQLCDTELPVREHAQCAAHCIEYGYWEWVLTNNRSIQDIREENIEPADHASYQPAKRISAALDNYHYDFFSQSLSEGATRGHDEEEEPDDTDSNVEGQRGSKEIRIEGWLEGIE
ncbi:hypothetical protein BO78DRAFT_405493 [Aspergillus sclerotiicarbonarius CBS 121057]|uniref:Uncharacterized protein n=1 Tax=Aspergillus sclerotiicarbonarius (strain CBS 121057 / IBT 28362) TaxID=1448318 RepID=A0A319F136_ASPSB|nr:hypothetical protein BO78DRAFT_405493 [Aspergillus sclerotiicarbonarius CBS 121057]